MSDKLPYIFAVDFDGTLVKEERWPDAPRVEDIINLQLWDGLKYVKEHYSNEVAFILWTCRHGIHIERAVDFCAAQGLTFDAVNENLPEIRIKYQNDPRKIYADLYIDDKAVFTNHFRTASKYAFTSILEKRRKQNGIGEINN